MEAFPESPVALHSQASVDPDSFILVTFRYGGKWVDVKNESRQRYAGGHQKTVKYERNQLNLITLREKVEDICSWVQEHQFELFYHIPRTSPKQYKALCDECEVENFRQQLWECSRVEVVVIAHNHQEENLNLRSSGLRCIPSADEIVHPSVVDDNYRWVPSLQAELLRRNPGSNITYLTAGTNNSFKRFYVSFKVSIDGFVSGCRPLIGLDACHLKSKYLGVLLSANTLDGNNDLFTIGFAVVEAESKSSWTWFLENLSMSIRFEMYPLAFISDMEKGLLEGIKIVFPNSEHRICIRHLWKNVKKQFRCRDGHKVHSLIWSAANTYIISDFESKLNKLHSISPEVYSYLTSLPYIWSRCQFSPEIKNDSNTNNMAESFNSWIAEAINKPVVDLIDTLRGMLMSQRANRNITSANWRSEIVPFAEEYIREITTRKQHFIIRQSTIFRCEVEGTNDRHVVDTQLSECTCMYWQMAGLPCIHAVAFISTRQHLLWHTYVDSHYSVYRYRLTYQGAISTLPSKDQWQYVDDSVAVGIPATLRPRGWPQTKRSRSFLEVEQGKSRNLHRCSRCDEWGHHRSTCKNPIMSTPGPSRLVRAKLPVRRGEEHGGEDDDVGSPQSS